MEETGKCLLLLLTFLHFALCERIFPLITILFLLQNKTINKQTNYLCRQARAVRLSGNKIVLRRP